MVTGHVRIVSEHSCPYQAIAHGTTAARIVPGRRLTKIIYISTTIGYISDAHEITSENSRLILPRIPLYLKTLQKIMRESHGKKVMSNNYRSLTKKSNQRKRESVQKGENQTIS